MTAQTLELLQRDHLAMSVAQALTLANDAAVEQGTTPAESLITVSEEPATIGRVWRIHYGPRDYVRRRGGDLIVLVDEQTASVQQVIRGQ
jgi:hypothetical protein